MDRNQQICVNEGAPMAATAATPPPPPPPAENKSRRQEITDDDDVEVIALSAEEIYAVTMFPCDICSKSFIREQNLLVHLQAHDIPYDLQNPPIKHDKDLKRKVYVCPEITCGYHKHPNALCDLPSLRKHYKRKHCEKTMNCPKCSRKYAVEADLRAHLKNCGREEYNCVCGSVFSGRDSYMAHKIPCDTEMAHKLYLLQNELQTSSSIVGRLSVPTVTGGSMKQPDLNSNTTPSASSFRFLSNTILPPLVPNNYFSPVPNLSASNQSVHSNMTTIDPAIYSSTQGIESIDRLLGVSSLLEAPQQGLILANSGTSASSFGILENSAAANLNVYSNYSSAASENSYFPVFESVSGTYGNLGQFRCHGNNTGGNVFNLQNEAMQGRDQQIGDSWNGTFNLQNELPHNGGLWRFNVDQINQPEQWHAHRVGRDDPNFPVLQNNFHFCKSRKN